MSTWVRGVCVALAIGCIAPASLAREEGEAAPAPERKNKLRLLIITGGHEFEREEFFQVFSGHPDIVWKEVVQPESANWFAPDKADQYDAMLWYDMYSNISEEQKRNLVALLEKGKPLVVMHHALADYQGWPEGLKIIGGRYYISPQGDEPHSTFRHDVDFKVHIVDPKHPITRFMKDFDIHDETYNHFQVLPEMKPLLTTDHPTSGKVIAWTHRYGKSPVCYIELGHDSKAYQNPNFRRLTIQAIRWVAGRLPDPSEEGFKPLFNGKDLKGWDIVGNPAAYVVKDGVLRSESGKDGQWLRTDREYADFILRLEWRVSKDGNSGVFIRAAKDGYPWETGSEIQISNEPRNNAHCTGSLYGSVSVDPRPDETPEVWHEFEVQCRGPKITVFADNIPVVDADANTIPALKARPLKGYIGLQDSHNQTGWIEFRNVRIKELK